MARGKAGVVNKVVDSAVDLATKSSKKGMNTVASNIPQSGKRTSQKMRNVKNWQKINKEAGTNAADNMPSSVREDMLDVVAKKRANAINKAGTRTKGAPKPPPKGTEQSDMDAFFANEQKERAANIAKRKVAESGRPISKNQEAVSDVIQQLDNTAAAPEKAKKSMSLGRAAIGAVGTMGIVGAGMYGVSSYQDRQGIDDVKRL